MQVAEVYNQGRTRVVRVNLNHVTAGVAADFRASVVPLARGWSGAVTLDLSAVGFMDSTGLGALVAVVKELGADRCSLCGTSPTLRTLLRLTRMDRVFRQFESAVAAAEAIGGGHAFKPAPGA